MSEPVRMADLTPAQQRVIYSLIEADKNAKEGKGTPGMAIAEAPMQNPMHGEYSQVQTTVESIGPTEAEALLSKNTHNRPARSRTADLAREMAEGRWVLNGESIKVSKAGRLLDGQHRLMAVVESGTTIQSVVVRGLPDQAQESVDIGAKRSLADVLGLRGEVGASTLAASLMIAWKIDRNGHLFGGAGYPYPSPSELLGYLDSNPGIRVSVQVGHRLNDGLLRYPPSAAAALHYLMSRLDADQADEFWTLLNEGAGLLSGHPILTLRKYLLRDLAAQRRMDQRYRVAITIKAWNAYRAERSLHTIRWTRGGDKPENFPVIK